MGASCDDELDDDDVDDAPERDESPDERVDASLLRDIEPSSSLLLTLSRARDLGSP